MVENKEQRAAQGKEQVEKAVEGLGWAVELTSLVQRKGPDWTEAHQPVKLKEGKPLWHVSNLERGGDEVASQQRLNQIRSMCGCPHGTRHPHEDGHDDLATNPND